MRWPAVRTVPRRGRAIAQLRKRLFPRPPLHHGVAPQAPVIGSLVRPPVTQLLLACPFHLFHLFEGLLDGRSSSSRLQDVPHRRRWVRATVGPPTAVVFLHDDDADDTPGWRPGRQEGLDGLGHLLLVLEARQLFLTLRVARPLGQAEPPLAVL